MRLTDAQIHAIMSGLTPFIHGASAELRLYGTHLHSNPKDAEIELLLLTDQPGAADNLIKLKHLLISNMKKNLGDHKIDLKIYAKEDLATDPFLKITLPKSVLLHRW
jgi:hypothetical protein